jgi:hypothetical protein
MSWLPFAIWSSNTAVGVAIRDSVWLFPVVETVHLLALALLGGVILAVDLRLCGLGLSFKPAGLLARDLRGWLVAATAVMIVSGALLFASEAIKCYENPAFRIKMIFLALALAFTFTVRQRALRGGDAEARSGWRLLIGCTSLVLWFGVAAGGRGIGFW